MSGKLNPKLLRSGLYEIDRIIGGFTPGQFIVIGARPKVGKSALMQSIMLNLARKGEVVDVYSLEMSKDDVTNRILSDLSGIAAGRIQSGKINEDELKELMAANVALQKLNIHIDPQGGISIGTLAIRARRMKKKRSTTAMFVDYVQLMRPEGGKDMTPAALETITTGLKTLAKELEVTIFGLAQLSRAAVSSDKKAKGADEADDRPQLHHLKGSGSFEQDADKVLLIHRQTDPSKMRPEEQDEGLQNAEIIVAANRQGPTGIAFVKYEASTTSFVSKAEIKNEGGANAKSNDRPF
jgi:replicative DNA helicase